MSLDERARAFLEATALFSPVPLEEMSVAELRARKIPVMGQVDPIREQFDLPIPTRAGTVPARVYVPLESTFEFDSLPQIVYFHGGGWVLGELEHYDQLCSALAHRSGCVVISVDYRLSPEFPYPAAVEDCEDAVVWLSQNPLAAADRSETDRSETNWKCDPQRIFVMGDSAGGNLAAAVSLQVHQSGSVPLCGQILIYPITDCDLERGSYQENGSGYLLTTSLMHWFWNHYCADLPSRCQPLASPLRAESLAGLPATWMATCQYDPLRDEGNEYALALQAAGVDVEHQEIPGQIHGFFRYLHTFPQANRMLAEIADWAQKKGANI